MKRKQVLTRERRRRAHARDDGGEAVRHVRGHETRERHEVSPLGGVQGGPATEQQPGLSVKLRSMARRGLVDLVIHSQEE